ncbi:50S ribosomal protein L18 [Candidatus Woesearchaeota archaeon]|nr:50S ribosomal protein L18 [Candidatus Woesearchaeota archaeon]
MKNKRYAVQFKRKRTLRTDYRRRAAMLLSGKPRIVVRKTLRRTIIQVAETSGKGDRIIVSADSSALSKYGWNHGMGICTAYLTGYMAGLRAMGKGVREGILDAGNNVHTKGGIIYAALKGVVDAGLSINHDSSVFPSQERLAGAHTKKPNITQEMESAKNRLAEDANNKTMNK